MMKLLLVALAILLWVRWADVQRWLGGRSSPTGPRPADRRRDQSAAEARRVLGLGDDADADAIRSAHRRLIAAVHPDQGGSADLAHRVNTARDTLLRTAARPAPDA